MGAAERGRWGWRRGNRSGAVLGYTGRDPTLFGQEDAAELADGRLYEIADRRQRYRVQNRALVGLLMLLLEVLGLGGLAMVGVGLHWYDQMFALEVLGITLTPSFAAWMWVIKWAFRPSGPDG